MLDCDPMNQIRKEKNTKKKEIELSTPVFFLFFPWLSLFTNTHHELCSGRCCSCVTAQCESKVGDKLFLSEVAINHEKPQKKKE